MLDGWQLKEDVVKEGDKCFGHIVVDVVVRGGSVKK